MKPYHLFLCILFLLFFLTGYNQSTPPKYIRSFKVGRNIFNIPNIKVSDFLKVNLDAKEIRSYIAGNDTLYIPIEKVLEFLNDIPNAKPILNYEFETPLQLLYEYISSKEGFTIQYSQFKRETDNESFLKKLHKNLTQKDGFALPFDQFKELIDGNFKISKDQTLYYYWFLTPSERKLKLIFDKLSPKNPELKDYGYESFAIDMKDDANLKHIYDGLTKKYLGWKTMGYDSFKKEMFLDIENIEPKAKIEESKNLILYNNLVKTKRVTTDYLGDFTSFNTLLSDPAKARKLHSDLIKKGFTEDEIGNQEDFLLNLDKNSIKTQPTLSEKKENSPLHFQIDKIRVGDTYIDLPIPSGFVKVDNTMGNLLESAKKLCPPTNTFLAYYISDEDYANFLANQDNTNEKYIIVEVFNGVKDLHVGYKDYRQFMNQYKNEYIDKYKKQYKDAEPKLSDHLANLDDRIKIKDFKVEPFGICYESKYSLSSGLLTKYNFSVENENSEDYIVAAISTITRIEDKPIFLFIYKNYRNKEDINSIKDINSVWLKEIEKKQGAFSFLTEIDFEDYKETILAILTLGFLWGGYFATRKISRKMKKKVDNEKPKKKSKDDLIDFDELLVNEYPSIEPIIEKAEDPKGSECVKTEKAIDVGFERTENPIEDEFEATESNFQTFNPELFKVSKRARLFHYFIDMALVYLAAYCSGYILPLFIDVKILAPWLKEHPYLFGAIVIFVTYFLQEFIFGKTLGKLITGTRVVNAKGLKPTLLQLIGRTATRLIPFEALSFLGSDKRGWHDNFSDTYVIKDK